MSPSHSPNLQLPLLALGQAQKEFYHNEALLLLDWLAHPLVQAIAGDPDVLTPAPGQAWIIADAAIGDWLGKDRHIAIWSEGGWRWIQPLESMLCIFSTTGQRLLFRDGTWQAQADIAAPSGGSVIDVEARAAISALLDAMRNAGVIEASA